MEGGTPLISCIVQATYDGYPSQLKCQVWAPNIKGGGSCLEVSDMNTSFIYPAVRRSTLGITASTLSLNVEIRIQVSICML